MTRLWPWLRLVLAVGVLAALGWRLGTDAFLDGLRAVTGWSVVAALGIGLLTTVLSAWRWCLVARRLGLPLPLRAAVSDYYRGLLLNAVLPAGVLGDVHRAVDHGRQSGDVARGVRAVLFERSAGQVVLVAAGLVVLAAGTADVDLGGPVGPGPVAAGLVVAGLVVAVLLATGSRRARRALAAVWADARVGLLAPAVLPKVLLASAATLAGHVALFAVAADAAGVDAPLGQVAALAVLALLVMAVPVNVGGFGPREAFLAVAFGAAGLGAAQGLTTGVVYGALALVAGLPGVVPLLRTRSEQRQVAPERLDERRDDQLALAGRRQ
ncbi:lysylphosphatidylglycerol synthase transmembrane domain-containing protein [Saccharothrix longispora]|uniref:lysylphosphatidylglycerol synthase transmembrane domain-containing protein n=1 Tax=Saccharothrix longispora TaxID=33920 RepID=UPI0028FDBF4D|nr:lysylphosphatidylglycerol synthase transmembrane domain-containing protein [Saccharothrix longispora]MBY8847740.1 flippase-like domain-containing protein [Saccharothrix sp. MB29]MDU0291544.1 lysylphosphatidylglycerol synthase transmembrane domain-containing protein [Saccharothrix longispora]